MRQKIWSRVKIEGPQNPAAQADAWRPRLAARTFCGRRYVTLEVCTRKDGGMKYRGLHILGPMLACLSLSSAIAQSKGFVALHFVPEVKEMRTGEQGAFTVIAMAASGLIVNLPQWAQVSSSNPDVVSVGKLTLRGEVTVSALTPGEVTLKAQGLGAISGEAKIKVVPAEDETRFDPTRYPMHSAAFKGNKDDLLKLLDRGSDINMPTDKGWTALHFATYAGNPFIIGLLLDRGANPLAKSGEGETPVAIAERRGNKDIFAILVAAVCPNPLNSEILIAAGDSRSGRPSIFLDCKTKTLTRQLVGATSNTILQVEPDR
jgi:hypothetical protein